MAEVEREALRGDPYWDMALEVAVTVASRVGKARVRGRNRFYVSRMSRVIVGLLD